MNQRKRALGERENLPQLLNGSSSKRSPNLLMSLFNPQGLPVKLKDIEVKTGLPSFYLSRLLKRLLGMPFRDFCTRMRCLNSLPSLLLTTKSIEDIARRAGFSESSNYSRAFTRAFGKRPSEFRNFFTESKFGQDFLTPLLFSFITKKR